MTREKTVSTNQLSLQLDAGSSRDLYYFALRPTRLAAQDIAEAASRYRNRFDLIGRAYDARRFHVSLNQVMSPRGPRKGDVEAAIRAAKRVRVAPFSVAFTRVRSFRNKERHPLVLCCEEGSGNIVALREELRLESARSGLWRGPRKFNPHLTLLRDKRLVPDQRLDKPICWTVEEFVLVHSLIGRSRHIDLGNWPLN